MGMRDTISAFIVALILVFTVVFLIVGPIGWLLGQLGVGDAVRWWLHYWGTR